ncbi:major facilitator family transporter [Striga asiatica]|uniref:Major facilitator family transporter n=1 Tax=Striga asiatica TaxID=4170 RepID=A0A5A7QDU4_STRAF|nr:major facilitator family transporter [Striga asiatica]
MSDISKNKTFYMSLLKETDNQYAQEVQRLQQNEVQKFLFRVGNSCFLCLWYENSGVTLSFSDYDIVESRLTSLYPNVTFLISAPLMSLIPTSARVLNTDPDTLGATRISSPIIKFMVKLCFPLDAPLHVKYLVGSESLRFSFSLRHSLSNTLFGFSSICLLVSE